MPIGAIPFPFGVCRICKDKATGLHYGVATCEGCKGFFKRSITKGEQFECLYNNCCDITPVTRSRCKACRFKRCMETGMSVESVRMGRIPKTEKNKVLDVFRRGGSDFNKHELIVNPTSSGNFEFDLKTTHVSTISEANVIDCVSNPTSTANCNAAQTCGTFNASNNKVCPHENACKSEVCHVQSNDHNSSDGLSSFLSQVDLSPEQNMCSRSLSLDALTHINASIPNNGRNIDNCPLLRNDCAAMQINNSHNGNNQKPYTYFSAQANASSWNSSEANCSNPFSDSFSASTESRSMYKLDDTFPMMNQNVKLKNPGHPVGQDKKCCWRQDSSAKGQCSCPLSIAATSPMLPSSEDAIQPRLHHANFVETRPRPGNGHNFMVSSQQIYNQHNATSGDNQIISPHSSKHTPSKGISRALVNVLMEEIVNSKGGIQLMYEKIGQKVQDEKFNEIVTPKRLKIDTFHERSYHCGINDKTTNSRFNNETTHADSQNDVENMEVSCSDHALDDGTPGQDNKGIVQSSKKEKQDQKIYLNIQGITLGMTILFKHCPEHREKIRQYRLGLIDLRILKEDDVEETYLKVIECIPDINDRILGFCNCVPGLKDIHVNDKALLMKRAYYDIWMLTSSEYFNGEESMLFLNSGEIYSAPVMRKILNDEMVDTILKFANQFNALGLTDLERAILCGVRLCAPESLELEDRTSVEQIHSEMLDTFAYEIKKNHEQNHARLLIDIFCLMPLLEMVNKIQKNIISKFTLDGPSNSV
ncbi:hypothetical protein ACF0H5_012786 [Mactra antiquata]